MTPEKIQRMQRILQRMNLDLARSVGICRDFGREILNEERHEFWALIKYMENVQDGVVQLDNINKTVFPRLLEFPEKSEDSTGASWQSLKGMRNRLAHAFDNIDHEIVWSTVTLDFPRLGALLEVLQFIRIEDGAIRFGFRAGLWRALPKVAQGEALGSGNSIPTIMFDESGDAICVRIGRIEDDKVAFWTSEGKIQITEIALVDPHDNDSIERLWPTDKEI